jgi:biopolymer transport protein ExbD
MMDINTTPLIDVMLVLLIMLIITIPIQLHSVNLNMPTGNPPPSDIKPEVLRIDIDARSTCCGTASRGRHRGEVERRFEQVAAEPVQPEVHLRPDKHAKYERGGRRDGVGAALGPEQAGHHGFGAVHPMSATARTSTPSRASGPSASA